MMLDDETKERLEKIDMSTFAGGMRLAAEGLALAALVDSYLERRFYSWVALSGSRDICTVRDG